MITNTQRAEEASRRMGTQEGVAGYRNQIAKVLLACRRGDKNALRQLVTLTYRDLHRIAHRQLERERSGYTLNTTGLIHEAFLKIMHQTQWEWQDRSHFLAIYALAMRQVIVDYAKKKRTRKHGGDVLKVGLDETQLAVSRQAEMLIAVDEALARLASVDERLIQIVECRFFAGYSERETAEALGISLRTVQRDWLRAKTWLREEIDR